LYCSILVLLFCLLLQWLLLLCEHCGDGSNVSFCLLLLILQPFLAT
jgi:hypothetical protein